MDIRDLIVRAIEGRDMEVPETLGTMESGSADLHEVPTAELLSYTVPYLKGTEDDRKGHRDEALAHLKEYCEDCEYLGLVGKETVELCRGKDRESKIGMWRKTKEFRHDFIDWEDREWVLALLEYFYVMAVRSIEHLNKEVMLLQRKDHECAAGREGIECVRVDSRGRIEDVLVRRNTPTMTLEEFADKLMLSMPESLASPEQQEESSSEKCSREEALRRDEEKDERRISRGNTMGMG